MDAQNVMIYLVLLWSIYQVEAAPSGMMAFFKLSSCPDGWIEHTNAQGRLIHSVTNPSHVNITLGTPLSDLTPPTHSHNASSTIELASQSISMLPDKTNIASDGTAQYDIEFSSISSEYPFIHLLLCRLVNDTESLVPTGLIAFFDKDECPSNWNPYSESIGRFLIPGFSVNGVVYSSSLPLDSGEDRLHNHQYNTTFSPSKLQALSAGSTNQAQYSSFTLSGNSSSDSSGFPYIQLLTCRSSEGGTGSDLPLGIHMFYGNGYCNSIDDTFEWQDANSDIIGRWIVSVPENGTVGVPFGGSAWDVSALTGRDGVRHSHGYNATITLPGSNLTGGFYGSYAGSGTYQWSGASTTGDIGMPYLSVPMCQLVGIPSPSASPVPNSSEGRTFKISTLYIAVIAGGGGLLLASGMILLVVLKKRKTKSTQEDAEKPVRNTMVLSAIVTDSSVSIDNIEIKEKLGGGNFGDVFKGIWNGTTPVALKKLKSKEQLEEFAREAQVLLSLNHPNIVRCLGIHTTSAGEQYIVMEYLSKGSLDSVLRKEHNIAVGDLLVMAKHAAAGMLYLEQQHIVHRDLALRNLLVARDESSKYTVKVSDFGLSRKIEEEGFYVKLDTQGVPIRWTAPEIFEKGIYTTKSDVWSFGITLWELFSLGQVPYPGMTNFEVMQKVVAGFRLGCPDECPNELHQLMLQCWQQIPEKRPGFKEIYDTIEAISKDFCKQTMQWNHNHPPQQIKANQGELYHTTNKNSATYF